MIGSALRITLYLLSPGLIAFFAMPVSGQEFLDVSFLPQSWAGVAFANVNAETFTIGRSGYLSGFDVYMYKGTEPLQDPAGLVIWEIRRTSNGMPWLSEDYGLLASGTFPYSSLPTDKNIRFTHIEIPGEGLPVTAGDYLAMVLRSPTNRYGWAGNFGPGIWFALNSGTGQLDPMGMTLGYQTFVLPQPKSLRAPIVHCSQPFVFECTNSVTLTIDSVIQDPNGNAVDITWIVDGLISQTNHIPEGVFSGANTSLTAVFSTGNHEVIVSASNRKTPASACATSVSVGDTTAPEISRVLASPDVIWPPNHKMIPVQITVDARDNCGVTACRILSVSSKDIKPSDGVRHFDTAWEIDQLLVKLRAEISPGNRLRVYTIVIECQDAAGNKSVKSVDVLVSR